MTSNKFSIVIPTRNRADTLFHSLRTCVRQDYDNLEIIVSDNNSQDHTREVVEQFDDERIRYLNTKEDLSMSMNWEFALNYVTADYVTFIGDDDGFLPKAVEWSNDILCAHPCDAFVWRKASYHWPQVSFSPNYLEIPWGGKVFKMNARYLMDLARRGLTSWGRFPSLYSGFIRTQSVLSVKSRSGGQFFWSSSPDLYSGYALASQIEHFLYTFYPIGVAGASKHSNGLNSNQKGGLESYKSFISSAKDTPMHPEVYVIPGALLSCAAECLMQANDHAFGGSLKLDKSRIFRNIIEEVSHLEDELYDFAVKLLDDMETKMDKKLLREFQKHRTRYPHQPIHQHSYQYNFSEDSIIIDASKHGVETIAEVCQLVENLLPDFAFPEKIPPVSPLNYLSTFLLRHFKQWLQPYSFGR